MHLFSFYGKGLELILPYLTENEKLFGIKIDDLLTVNGKKLDPLKVYRKISPSIEGTPSTPDKMFMAKRKKLMNSLKK